MGDDLSDDDDDDETYRARPVVPGCCVLREFCTLALSIRPRGRVPLWLLGQVVYPVWAVSANLINRWWLSVYGYSSAPLQG